ncbi:MAG: DinB family protein [Dehalococcoidia bacterium]
MHEPGPGGGDELAEQIRDGRGRLLDQARHLSDEALRARPDAEDWSVIEVLAHLPDVDEHWLAQALAIRDNPDHVFVHFDDERWKREHPNVRDEPLPAVLQAMQAAHDAVLATLAHLDEDDLDRAAKHPRGIAYTVRDVFLRYPTHDENHASQIASIKQRLGTGHRP